MIELSNNIFDEEVTECNAPVLVVFEAPWCTACKSSHRVLGILQSELTEVKFCTVDVDREFELKEKYSIKSVPTVLLFYRGFLRGRKSGMLNKSIICDMLAEISSEKEKTCPL